MRLVTIIGLLCVITVARADDSKSVGWNASGAYTGYAESYAWSKERFVLDGGCTDIGEECKLKFLPEGLELDGRLYHWDAVGLQASGKGSDVYQRLTVLGKFGSVLVVDLYVEKPKGTLIRLIRMTVAPEKG